MRTSTSEASPQVRRLRGLIENEARGLGFDAVAFTTPDAVPKARERLLAALADNHHGSMAWMEETAERRGDPALLWPEARSVIMLAMSYAPEGDALAALHQREAGAISVYARNRDYHDVIKGKLKELAGKLAARSGEDVKVFVDTAPVMEKPLAEAAGLGWQGKHTNLVSRELGSWFFLASIFTTASIAPDRPEVDHCGTCRACLDACPTDAFPAPYRLDARRCISYLTIENKGPIPHGFRKAIGNRIYGCDDCLAACPWNKFAQAAHEAKLVARAELNAPRLMDLLQLDDPAFRAFFSGSPIKRIGRDRFIRNCLIAAGNSGSLELVQPCRALVADPAPLVRGAAIWALAQLGEHQWLAERRNEGERIASVVEEWKLALGAG